LCKDVREVGRVAVKTEHVAAAAVDDAETAAPELVAFRRQFRVCHGGRRRRTASTATGRDEKRLQWVADFVAHVRVGEVEAGEDERVQAAADADVLQCWLSVEFGADEQVDEDDVGRVDESDVLPALQQQRPVDAAQPRRGVRRIERVAVAPAATSQVLAETAQ